MFLKSWTVAVALVMVAMPAKNASADNDIYYSQTVDDFLQSCASDDNLCLAVISPRISAEGFRFCLPDDQAYAGDEILRWLRANRNAMLAEGSKRFGQEYLARGIRSAMGNLWGEKGTACPFPQSGGTDDDGDDLEW